MKKMSIVAGIMVLGFVTQAADWFNGGIETGWPEAESMKGGSWSNTNGSSYAESKVTVSADESTPLTFEATTNKTVTSEKPTISANLGFTAFSSEANLPSVPSEAKAGVIVCGNYFYVVAKDPNGDTNTWTATSISKSDTAQVAVTFLDSTTVEYAIGDSKVTNNVVAVTTVTRVRMSGEGSISSLTASSETRGPQTPATGGGSVEKVADNVYKATPSPEGNITIVDGTLGANDIILITETNDVQVTGVPEKQIQVVLHNTPVSNSVFTGGSPFSTALNKDGSAVIGTETIPVTPQLSGTDEEIKPFVLDDNAAVGVKTIPGLTYKLVRQVVLGTNEKTVDSTVATESRTKLQDKNKPTDKAFYIIEVTK